MKDYSRFGKKCDYGKLLEEAQMRARYWKGEANFAAHVCAVVFNDDNLTHIFALQAIVWNDESCWMSTSLSDVFDESCLQNAIRLLIMLAARRIAARTLTYFTVQAFGHVPINILS